MARKAFEAVILYENLCEAKRKLVEQVGDWALEELLLLRAEAYFTKKQKLKIQRCFHQWAEGTACLSHSVEDSSQEEEEETRTGVVVEAEEVDPARVTREEIEDELVSETLRALEECGTEEVDTRRLVEVIVQIQEEERENVEVMSTVQFNFQHVNEEKISVITKGNGGLTERIKLSRAIQNMKILRYKAELLGIETRVIDETLRVLDYHLLHHPTAAPSFTGLTARDTPAGDSGATAAESKMRSMSQTDSGRTVYESAGSLDFDGGGEASEDTYNSHLRSNMYGITFNGDLLVSDEDDDVFESETPEAERFGVNRAKQLLHSLQNMKDVGKSLDYDYF
ncbi:hypothetical protein HOP50_06g42700 [Chloropicon primus]|uniref:Uncharacterized protein n=2 Tax=Chloropicon primus TaxID=1764295 RepID=A0A5B8MMV4_9CHLO|nr:hypothetical protein A3770_06p42450 [Chloropicon primus]UPR00949.1 hypothetical protein HOP50_06g42700 [Chloropicon primus]|eukprot:QDZ21727.1 hypothetical protein A3770_06p42450 [Chloropicon primus]